jgi:hypothetical protein
MVASTSLSTISEPRCASQRAISLSLSISVSWALGRGATLVGPVIEKLEALLHQRDAAFAASSAGRYNNRRVAITLDGGDIAYV